MPAPTTFNRLISEQFSAMWVPAVSVQKFTVAVLYAESMLVAAGALITRGLQIRPIRRALAVFHAASIPSLAPPVSCVHRVFGIRNLHEIGIVRRYFTQEPQIQAPFDSLLTLRRPENGSLE